MSSALTASIDADDGERNAMQFRCVSASRDVLRDGQLLFSPTRRWPLRHVLVHSVCEIYLMGEELRLRRHQGNDGRLIRVSRVPVSGFGQRTVWASRSRTFIPGTSVIIFWM